VRDPQDIALLAVLFPFCPRGLCQLVESACHTRSEHSTTKPLGNTPEGAGGESVGFRSVALE
jgi:hypothetical protein